MATRRHHRFPRGETCSECPARRWYLENGRRYCENGHQVEGYIQFDIDEDDNFGKTGRVARKKKETRDAPEGRALTGNEARQLYLECLQQLLRRQVLWLVRRKGLHPELEAVCRDLWLLRVRDFSGIVREGGGKEKEGSEGRGRGKGIGDEGEDGKGVGEAKSRRRSGADGSSGDGGLIMFSSRVKAEAREEEGEDGGQVPADDDGGWGRKRKRRSWSGEIWPLPAVLDTLALVYLGCVLRQEPVRIGDVFRWARDNQLPFLGAIDYVPKEWRHRLPGWACHALLTRYARFRGGELHRAVMDLMLGYKENHGLVFPALQAPPLLFLYVRDLALPPEVHPFAQKTCRLLDLALSFPTRDQTPKKHALLDIPEVLLVAALVVATKHLYPLDGIERFPRDARDPLCLQMDWAAWEAEFAGQPDRKRPGLLRYGEMEPQAIWTMDKEEINELLDWFQETQVEKHPPGDTEIERLFPLPNVPPPPKIPESSQEDLEERIKRVQGAMIRVQPRPDPGEPYDGRLRRLGSDYRCYKDPDELEGHVRRFYEVVADVAGLSVRDLVRAVYSLEQRLMDWQQDERRRQRG